VDEPVLCRWRSAQPRLMVDVMPTDPAILGFSNPWYEEAISSAATIALDSGGRDPGGDPVEQRQDVMNVKAPQQVSPAAALPGAS
jgi:hypothetical protein